ncbi:MAG: hypothetical protein ACOYI5_00620 [Christensenellales bacterium]|jgi:hypothetical protein
MKKLFALLLVALIPLAGAFAEEPSVPVADLGDIEIVFSENRVILAGDLSFSLPEGWTALDLTQELTESGILFAAEPADLGHVIGLSYAQIGANDTTQLADALAQSFQDVAIVKANGMEMIRYTGEGGAYTGLSLLDGAGGMYTLTISPMPSDELAAAAFALLSTLEFADPAEG